MFKQEYYVRASEVFGCSIGVANTITWRTREESKEEFTPESFKSLDDQIKVNQIIQDVIEGAEYPEFMRRVLKLEKAVRKGTKSVTIYKRARNGES